MRKSGQAYVMTVLLLGFLLAMTTESGGTEGSHRDGTSNEVNSTSSDSDGDSKLFLQFCVKKTCAGKGGDSPVMPDCYCCQSLPGRPCFDTEDQCRGKCPKCDPRCQPPTAAKLHA